MSICVCVVLLVGVFNNDLGFLVSNMIKKKWENVGVVLEVRGVVVGGL